MSGSNVYQRWDLEVEMRFTDQYFTGVGKIVLLQKQDSVVWHMGWYLV